MIALPELKALAKQNDIRYTGLNKDEIIAILIDKNIMTISDICKEKIIENKKAKPIACQSNNKNYEYLKGIRTNPVKVEVFDRKTNETNTYTSKYKAGRVLGFFPAYFKDGSILNDRYVIKLV